MVNEDIFDNWYSDVEDNLKEDFIMSFNNRALREWIQEYHLDEFLEYFEQGFEDFTDERYNTYLETRNEKVD